MLSHQENSYIYTAHFVAYQQPDGWRLLQANQFIVDGSLFECLHVVDPSLTPFDVLLNASDWIEAGYYQSQSRRYTVALVSAQEEDM